MKVFIKSDIRDNLGELSTLADRVSVMLNDVLNHLLYPLDMGRESNSPLELATVVAAEAHPATVKMEIADSVIEEMKDKLEALHRIADPRPLEGTAEIPQLGTTVNADDPEKVWPTKAPTQPTEEAVEPVKGADKLARDEIKENMIAEYMASINDFVSVIETKEDFTNRMNELKKAARILASGDDITILSNDPAPW